MSAKAIEFARSKKLTSVRCSICPKAILLDDLAEEADENDDKVDQLLDRSDEERERQTRLAALVEKERHGDFHVFLCHGAKDKPQVRKLDAALRQRGLLPWFDERSLLAGNQFAPGLLKALEAAPALAVVVGPHPLGRWQEQEFWLYYQRLVERLPEKKRLRLIPVLLPGAPEVAELPLALRSFSLIDFRKSEKGLEDAGELRRLVKAILGEEQV